MTGISYRMAYQNKQKVAFFREGHIMQMLQIVLIIHDIL